MGMLGMRAYPFEEKLSRVGRYFAGKSFKTTSEALFRRANVRNTASNAFAVHFSSSSAHGPKSPIPAAHPTISTRMVRKRGNCLRKDQQRDEFYPAPLRRGSAGQRT